MKILLYFGSFNPIHRGHIDIALQTKKQYTDINELWFVLSPRNPFKNSLDLWPEEERKYLLDMALAPYPDLKVCEIERSLPQPSYTVKTLDVLYRKHPGFQFDILMGTDNYQNFSRWKEYRRILERSSLYVYPRKGDIQSNEDIPYIKVESPLLDISSTQIRENLRKKIDCSALLPPLVWEYLKKKFSI